MTDREAIDVLFNEWKCIDRNDGIHCDRKCESCDLVMDVGIIREAFNMAISALQAHDSPKPTAESVQNVQNEDLISRKAAIDALDNIKIPRNASWYPYYQQALTVMSRLPSAQPEQRWIPVSKKLPEVGRSVLFSRRSMGTREGCLQADGKWWQYRWNEILNANQVNAWMPLPRVVQGGKENR